MSTPEINQVLAQMRAMGVEARGSAADDTPSAGNEFAGLLRRSIDAVNDNQARAGDLRTAFEVGEPNIDLADVMIAVQKSSVSFQAMVQVRNKLVDAYKDVMNMPL
jgi:flagellar hook-basal body complex protein FliE